MPGLVPGIREGARFVQPTGAEGRDKLGDDGKEGDLDQFVAR
jgi:hypothetical protein